jgi:putative aldouronate transport system permease protein
MSSPGISDKRISPVHYKKASTWKLIISSRYFYLMFLPTFLLLLVFTYYPMYGIQLAFKDLNFAKGITGSTWTSMHGLKHFYSLLTDMDFQKAFVNTLIISLQRLIFEFPVPIILALLMNEIRKSSAKRIVQTVLTFPHFLSWVVVTGIFFNILGDSGILNETLALLGFQKIHLLTQASTFRGLLYITSNWKEAGWGTIIYLAAISGISVELYEAAIVDGAKRFQLMRYITWPAMMSVIGIMFVLAIANIMSAGFDQIFNMYNPAVYNQADIIDTFIYRRTFVSGLDFASSTAIGLFKSVINFIMLFAGNYIVLKTTGKGIY